MKPRLAALAMLATGLGLMLALAVTPCACGAMASRAAGHALELIGTQRTTHLAASLTFRIAPGQSRLSEIRVRSGSLALHLEAVEIVFADGGQQRAVVQESLGPGHQSRPIAVDSRRAVREILVTKRPGLRPGETTLQLLGKVVPAAAH